MTLPTEIWAIVFKESNIISPRDYINFIRAVPNLRYCLSFDDEVEMLKRAISQYGSLRIKHRKERKTILEIIDIVGVLSMRILTNSKLLTLNDLMKELKPEKTSIRLQILLEQVYDEDQRSLIMLPLAKSLNFPEWLSLLSRDLLTELRRPIITALQMAGNIASLTALVSYKEIIEANMLDNILHWTCLYKNDVYLNRVMLELQTAGLKVSPLHLITASIKSDWNALFEKHWDKRASHLELAAIYDSTNCFRYMFNELYHRQQGISLIYSYFWKEPVKNKNLKMLLMILEILENDRKRMMNNILMIPNHSIYEQGKIYFFNEHQETITHPLYLAATIEGAERIFDHLISLMREDQWKVLCTESFGYAALTGNSNMIKHLLSNSCKYLIDLSVEHLYRLLSEVCAFGHFEVIQELSHVDSPIIRQYFNDKILFDAIRSPDCRILPFLLKMNPKGLGIHHFTSALNTSNHCLSFLLSIDPGTGKFNNGNHDQIMEALFTKSILSWNPNALNILYSHPIILEELQNRVDIPLVLDCIQRENVHHLIHLLKINSDGSFLFNKVRLTDQIIISLTRSFRKSSNQWIDLWEMLTEVDGEGELICKDFRVSENIISEIGNIDLNTKLLKVNRNGRLLVPGLSLFDANGKHLLYKIKNTGRLLDLLTQKKPCGDYLFAEVTEKVVREAIMQSDVPSVINKLTITLPQNPTFLHLLN